MPKMEHKINYFDFQPSVQSVELFNLWIEHAPVLDNVVNLGSVTLKRHF